MNPIRKAWRLALILRAYRGRKERLSTLPIRLWVEAASPCNLRCVMCPNKTLAPADRGVMRLDLFRQIVDEARDFVFDMYLHHRGEPLLNPALGDMIRYARAAGIATRLHSNGTLLDEVRARMLLDAGPDLVSFSVDGFEREAYENIRVGAEFETTVANILRFAELRRRERARRPYLVVERIRFRQPPPGETPEKIAALTRRFLQAGVDEVLVKDEYVWAQTNAPAPQGIRTYARCTFPWYAMVILWNGVVTACPQDFDGVIRLGDASRQSLQEIWNGAAYGELRQRMNADVDSLPLCRKCDRLYRKTVGGIPLQYMVAFLTDHLVGYGSLRKRLGTFERNAPG